MLLTEQKNLNSENIDLLPTEDILQRINQEDQKIAEAVKKELPVIAKAVDTIYEALENGHRIFYIGAGTSGRLGVLDASECPPTFGVPPELFTGVIAGGDYALRNAVEHVEDQPEKGAEDVQNAGFVKGDVLVGIASSGRTPYVIGALQWARQLGSPTIALACVPKSAIGEAADIAIEVLTGPEIVTGSTRMKAGTAQKMVLNMLSTTAMIRAGKVFDGFMVDVKPVNSKLVDRSIRIIQKITDVSAEKAEQLLQQADHNVRVAILLGLTDLDPNTANELLDKYDGHISKVIRELKNN